MKKTFALFLATFILAGCATQMPIAQRHTSVSYGKIVNVREYTVQKTENNIGAVAIGGVIGGLLGNQIGGGSGKKIATVAGAGVGAYTANEMSKKQVNVPMVELHIQDETGPSYTIDQEKNANYHMGQRVRVTITGNKGHVTPY